MRVNALRVLFLAAIAAGLALPLCGQIVGMVSGQAGPLITHQGSSAGRQPYTAEFKMTNVQTLADGTTITRESREIHAQDSEGRMLNESSNMSVGGESGTAAFTTGNVVDSVDGTRINWNSTSKKATVLKVPVGDQKQGCWKSDSGHMTMRFGSPSHTMAASSGAVGMAAVAAVPPPNAEPTKPVTEDLGIETIQGIEAHGHRTTITTPAGMIGNDKPIVRVSEIWVAKELGLVVREVINDPRTGKRTKELVNVTQGEPDPSLFQPPEGYEVVNEEMRQVPCDQM